MDTVEAAGLRIAFERQGRGPPLLMLHGLPGDRRAWRRQLDALSDEFTVIAWDAPGCGRSEDPASPAALGDVAQCLIGFISALGLEHPHVLGLSWGGGVALELFRRTPAVPRSLVLASTYAGWAGSMPADAVAERLDAYLLAARTPPEDAFRSWGSGFFSPSADMARVEELRQIVSDFHPDAFAEQARSFATTDLRDVLPTIHVPTLVLHADADVRSPLPIGRALHDAVPGSKLVVLEGVGHVSNIEAPDRFNAAVRRFLRTVPVA